MSAPTDLPRPNHTGPGDQHNDLQSAELSPNPNSDGPSFEIVLFDLDHTLFDFEASKAAAFEQVLSGVGVADPSKLLDVFEQVERPLWNGLEQGSLTLETLNDERFRMLCGTPQFRSATSLSPDPQDLASDYLGWLGKSGGLLPGARAVLDALLGNCRMALVSNGYGVVQRARLNNFDLGKYFEVVVVSDEVGAAKPHPDFFSETFKQLGNPPKTSALMVGDSLTSDMAGGSNYGIKCCWFNPFNKPQTGPHKLDFVVTDLESIAAIVL